MKRSAFTLTELLIAMTVIAFLATLTALYFPRLSDSHSLSRGSDLLTQWVMQARQQAQRDGVPTGLRLIVSGGVCRSVVTIRQPEDVAQGVYVGSWDETSTGNALAWFRLPIDAAGVEAHLDSPRFGIESGDYLNLYGTLHRIESATHYSLTLSKGTAQLPGPTLPDANRTGTAEFRDKNPDGSTDNGRTNYRIFRAPQPVPGEGELTLPEGVSVDLSGSSGLSEVNGRWEIVFSPRGALVGAGTGDSQVILWLCLTGKEDAGILVTVQPRTGFVGQHPVASGSDPYLFTRDGRSSGM